MIKILPSCLYVHYTRFYHKKQDVDLAIYYERGTTIKNFYHSIFLFNEEKLKVGIGENDHKIERI